MGQVWAWLAQLLNMHDLMQLWPRSNEGCVFSRSSGASGGRQNKKGRGSVRRGALLHWDCLWCSLADDESWLLLRLFSFFFFGTYGRRCWPEEPCDAESLCINVTRCSCRHMSADNWRECCTQTDSTELQKNGILVLAWTRRPSRTYFSTRASYFLGLKILYTATIKAVFIACEWDKWGLKWYTLKWVPGYLNRPKERN